MWLNIYLKYSIYQILLIRCCCSGSPQDFRWEIWKVLLRSKVDSSSSVTPEFSASCPSSPGRDKTPSLNSDASNGNKLKTPTQADWGSEAEGSGAEVEGSGAEVQGSGAKPIRVGGLGSFCDASNSPQSESHLFPQLSNLTLRNYMNLAERPSIFQSLINIDIPRYYLINS